MEIHERNMLFAMRIERRCKKNGVNGEMNSVLKASRRATSLCIYDLPLRLLRWSKPHGLLEVVTVWINSGRWAWLTMQLAPVYPFRIVGRVASEDTWVSFSTDGKRGEGMKQEYKRVEKKMKSPGLSTNFFVSTSIGFFSIPYHCLGLLALYNTI